MEIRLYVGNLSYNARDEDLKNLFSKYGSVQSVNVITDRLTGRSKGFAFVQMSSPEEAQKALELNGSSFLGRTLRVSEAKPRETRFEGERGPRGYDSGSYGRRYSGRGEGPDDI